MDLFLLCEVMHGPGWTKTCRQQTLVKRNQLRWLSQIRVGKKRKMEREELFKHVHVVAAAKV